MCTLCRSSAAVQELTQHLQSSPQWTLAAYQRSRPIPPLIAWEPPWSPYKAQEQEQPQVQRTAAGQPLCCSVLHSVMFAVCDGKLRQFVESFFLNCTGASVCAVCNVLIVLISNLSNLRQLSRSIVSCVNFQTTALLHAFEKGASITMLGADQGLVSLGIALKCCLSPPSITIASHQCYWMTIATR